MKCKHENGWILKEEIVINPNLTNDNIQAEFECNNIGCGEIRKFEFDILNIKEKNNENP